MTVPMNQSFHVGKPYQCQLHQQLLHDLPDGYQRVRAIQVVVQECLSGNAESGVQRGDDVAGDQWVIGGVSSDVVAGSVDQAWLKASADQLQRVTPVPVVAARSWVYLRRATEVAQNRDNRPFEHPAIGQVLNQA